MSLRARMSLMLALFVALSAASVAIFAYNTTSHQLILNVDQSLTQAAQSLNTATTSRPDRTPPPPQSTGFDSLPQHFHGYQQPFGPGGLFQLAIAERISPSGTVTQISGSTKLPVSKRDLGIAATYQAPWLRTESYGGVTYRIITLSLRSGGALEIGRDINDVATSLQSLKILFVLSGFAIALLAAIGGYFGAGVLVRPILRLSKAVQVVSHTEDFDIKDEETRTDEIGVLARSFVSMLDDLRRSQAQQRRLIQDASHELRTPLTSLRTNIDLLRKYQVLPLQTRDRILTDLDGEMTELTQLMSELVDLAIEGQSDEALSHFSIGEIIRSVVVRFEGRSGRVFTVSVPDHDLVMVGRQRSFERAISNLLDNAVKFSPSNTKIAVDVTSSSIEVRNVAQPITEEDLPHLFDRFYRTPQAWPIRGSGLGLAIVKEVIDGLGGAPFARNIDQNGTNFLAIGFTFPGAELSP